MNKSVLLHACTICEDRDSAGIAMRSSCSWRNGLNVPACVQVGGSRRSGWIGYNRGNRCPLEMGSKSKQLISCLDLAHDVVSGHTVICTHIPVEFAKHRHRSCLSADLTMRLSTWLLAMHSRKESNCTAQQSTTGTGRFGVFTRPTVAVAVKQRLQVTVQRYSRCSCCRYTSPARKGELLNLEKVQTATVTLS